MAYGEMPQGFSGLELLLSSGRLAATLSGELSRWEVGGGGVVVDSLLLNKGRSGFRQIQWRVDVSVPLAGRGGEGRGWDAALLSRSGVGAGELLQEYSSCSWQCARLVPRLFELWRSEHAAWFGATVSSSSIRLVYIRGSASQSSQRGIFRCAHHGGEVEDEFLSLGNGWWLSRQGSCVASPGSALTPASSPSSIMVVWQPLPPLTLATVLSGRRLWSIQPPGQVAVSEALRAAGSVLPPLLPKWFVPCEVEVGCAASLFRRAKKGAELDCDSYRTYQVL